MVALASLAAVLLYLAPVAVVLVARARRDTEAWELALAIPFAVAVDLLSLLLLTRVLRLEAAALASRGAWITVGTAYLARRARRGALRWPLGVGRRELLAAAAAAAVAVALSLSMSRPYAVWDRLWHIPLVSSLRAQTLPFSNVYEPGRPLAYHISGDVLAAAVQSLSFGVVHASLALSLAHDALFGLTGVCLALLLRHVGVARPLAAALATLGVLLSGPVTLLEGGANRPTSGQMIVNLLSLSFRPHVALALLLILGFAGAVLVRLREGGASAPPRVTGAVVLAVTALLAITDEASTGVLGIALGAAWLIEPEVLHPRRAHGAALLAALAALVVGANALYSGSLVPGAQQHAVAIVPWRAPGFVTPSLPLWSAPGSRAFVLDLLGVLVPGITGAALALWTRGREVRVSAVFAAALVLVSLVCLTRVDVNGSAPESHRFITAALFVLPVFSIAWLALRRRATPRAPAVSAAGVAVVLALGLGAASTVEWLATVAPKQCDRHANFFGAGDLYAVDCRREVGARLGEAAAPTYIEPSVWYLYAGCRPIYAPAPITGWHMKVSGPHLNWEALAGLDRDMLRAEEALPVVCSARRAPSRDPVCARAAAEGGCAAAGAAGTRCSLSAGARKDLLGHRPSPPEKRAPPKR